MLELYVIRHGQAGTSVKKEKEDEARQLTKKGKKKMHEIAKGLKKLEIAFDIVLTSPFARAKESAEILCNDGTEVTLCNQLKPGSSYSELIKFLNTLKGAKKIALVGHEPFLSRFTSFCLSKSKKSFIDLKKGAVLKLGSDKKIKAGGCELAWLMEPSQLTRL